MREFGFREAMDYFSLPVNENFIIDLDPTYDQAVVDMGNFLDKKRPLPSAFFCMNDMLAYGCMKSLRQHNYKIPNDISVIGFDDLPSSAISDPPLTTVRLPLHQIGQRALEKLLDRMANPAKSTSENILISGSLIVRDSVKKI
jgi:LacI family transcriptional regulator